MSPTPSRNSSAPMSSDVDFLICEVGGTVGDIESLPFLEAIRQLGNEFGPSRTPLRASDPGALDSRRRRAQDQADPAFGQGAAERRHPARHPALPLRPRNSRECAAQDRAVLQPPAEARDPGARRRHHLSGARSPITPKASTPRSAGISASPRRRRICRAGAGSSSASASRRARSTSPSSANTRACWTPTNPWARRSPMAASPTMSGSSSTGSIPRSSSARTRSSISKGCTASWCPAASASAGPKARSQAARFARERKVPYFGICFGMQMAVIEAARNLAGIRNAELHRVRSVPRSRWSG